jgi:DNA-binding beta-propeller fold protein YncE
VDPDTGSLYVGTANVIHVLDPLDGTETASIPTDGEVRDIVVDRPTPRVFIGVATPLGGTLMTVDQQTNTIVKSASFPISPTALALDSEANRLYALNIVGYASVSVLDASSLAILKSRTDFTAQPFGIAVNPTTQRVYVSQAADNPGLVTVHDVALQSRIATIAVGAALEYLAVSERLDRVYVANVNSTFVSVIGDGPPPGPASPTPASEGPSGPP